jgi:hypothetical protein
MGQGCVKDEEDDEEDVSITRRSSTRIQTQDKKGQRKAGLEE